MEGKPLTGRPTRRALLRLVCTAFGAGMALPVDARYIEPYALEITRHEVPLPDLPPALDGLRLVHLTDLHQGPVTPREVIADALRATKALRPDAVMITGDFVHRHWGDACPLARLLAGLAPPLGVWGCLGNHDYSSASRITSALASGGVRMLRNAAAPLAPGLWVAGIEDTLRGRPDAGAAMAPVPRGAAAVFLTHNPVGVFACDRYPWLVLAGHTHGGQIRIPGVPPRFPPGMDGFPYIAGWGVFDRARLYISRGVGMGGVPFRFRCRPELACITLRRGDGPPRAAGGLASRALDGGIRLARRCEKMARRAGGA